MRLVSFLKNLHNRLGRKNLSHDKRTQELIEKQTQDMLAIYQEVKNGLFFSKEKLQQIRNDRLRKLLKFAKLHSPFYRKTLVHIDADNFSEDRMDEIPILTKKILMDNWDTICTNPNITLEIANNHLEEKTTIRIYYIFKIDIKYLRQAKQQGQEECSSQIGMNVILNTYTIQDMSFIMRIEHN